MESLVAVGVHLRARRMIARLRDIAAVAVLLTGLFTVWAGPLAGPVAADGTYTISGTVTGPGDVPLAGVLVGACPALFSGPRGGCGDVHTTTDVDGNYVLAGLAPGSYSVTFDGAPDYPFGIWSASGYVRDRNDGTAVDVTTGDVAGIDMSLPAGGTISGTVTGPGGLPLAGIQMTACLESWWGDCDGGDDSVTDAFGHYTIRGLGPGTTYFVMTDPTYALGYYDSGSSSGFTSDFTSASALPVGSSPVTGIDIRLPLGHTISGTVTDSDGHPIAGIGANASNYGLWSEISTGPDGTYTLTGVAPGSHVVSFSGNETYAGGYYGDDGFTPDPAAATVINVPPNASGVDVTLPLAGSISGIVTGPGGAALVGMAEQVYTCYVPLAGPTAACAFEGDPANDGTYTVNGLAPGSYDVFFQSPDGTYLDGYYSTSGLVSDEGSATPITVPPDATGIDAELRFPDGPLDHIVVSPGTTTIVAGAKRSFTAEGFDAHGNDLGDVTSETAFSVDGGGSCTGTSCTATTLGDHTVIGTDDAATGTATLHVTGTVPNHLVLTPASATVAAGSSQVYAAEAFDAQGDSLGDVTASTTFRIIDGAVTCTGASCRSNVAGDHTVVGIDGAAAGVAALHVLAPWAQFHNGPTHEGNNVTETILSPANVAGLGVKWTATTGDYIDSSSPTVANGVVYVGSMDGNLYAYAADCGTGGSSCSPIWKGVTGDSVQSSPTVADGVVYIGSEGGKWKTGKVYAYAVGCASGGGTCSPIWTADTGGSIYASPAVVDGVVYIADENGKVSAYAVGCASDGGTCSPLWTASAGRGIWSSPAVADGVVYVGSRDGKLYAFAAGCASGGGTCSPLWTGTTGGDIYSSPAVADGVVYIGSTEGALYAFAVGCASGGGTCSPLWIGAAGSWIAGSSPAVADGVVYAGSGDGKLYAFEVGCSTGGGSCSPLWTGTTGGWIWSSPAVANGVVYVASSDGKLYAFAVGCGSGGGSCSPLWTHAAGEKIASSPAIADGVVYVGSWDHKLYAFGLDRGAVSQVVLSPSSSPITAGGSQSYTAEGFDAYGNSLGDVTSKTTFTIDGGTCNGASCTSTVAGDHTVTGMDGTATGTATLHVTAGLLNHLVLSPSGVSIVAGRSQTYTAQAVDQYGNPRGDVTSSTTFTIDGGTCNGASCRNTVAGDHTVTGTYGAATGTATLHVNAGPLSYIVLSPPNTTITAGASKSYTAEAFDAHGNSLGDVTAATIFEITGTGSCTGASCTSTAAGDHKVFGYDGAIAAWTTLHVIPSALDHLVLSPPSAPITAGGSQAYTAEGFDIHGNSLGDVTGSTTFTIDSVTACPAAYCPASVAGDHTVTGVDGTASGTATLHVAVGSSTILVVTGLTTPRVAGTAGTITVTAQDGYGNTAGGYSSTVQIASTDGAAALPASSTLTDGVGTFSVTLKTAGTWSVTATDTGNSSITGSQSGIVVNPAAATHLVVSGHPSADVAGVAHNITVTAKDAYNNTVTGYTGTVHITSTDTAAVLPASSKLTAGVHAFSVTLKTAGTRTITATDTVTTSIKGSQTGIVVSPAAATHLVVSGYPTSDVAGVAHNVTVTAKDAYNNTATGYRGTVHITTTSTSATLPANFAYTATAAGVHVFSVTLKTAGTRTVTATDTKTASVKGTQSGIVVSPAAATHLVLSGYPTSDVKGVAHTVTVTAKDAYGNTAAGYRGTVHFTSSDTKAKLPANYTFTATAAGVHTFSVTLKTAGTRSITATDTKTATIKGTESGIVVK